MVGELVRYADPVTVEGLARQMFDVEAHGPTRPHPRSPHTGLLGLAARRMWALADRFWDATEGRVIPEPVHPAPHRHDSLMAQYLVADPKFDADATIMEHRHGHPKDGCAAAARLRSWPGHAPGMTVVPQLPAPAPATM